MKKWSFLYLLSIKKEKNLKFGKGITITKSTKIEGTNTIGDNCRIYSSHIGFGSYISENSTFIDSYIGKFCSIGPNVNCIFGNHPTSKFISTHPSFFSTRKQVNLTFVSKDLFHEFSKQKHPEKKYSINIGNDVWLGANVTLLDGITIGDGAIIAANSLVNKDIAPYSIVGGIPAKIIKMRFENEDVDYLLNLKWWNKSIEWITKHAAYFDDISKLKTKLRSEKIEKTNL
ncbi:hypothetical protein A9200_13280 [Maribacter hydrothermalis]|uniref:Acetyltransferase (Isoleucine patch superfamily) n=1 Tax=Maribacter hydrothermalis TaxID=1836467 RepID=A0A1B7ZDL5_9FLAO|nr:CatB-related O-acetyltransferase [Maribacter hydrothermalis]APQ19377.1 hypothetical protein BTR34_14815 [Maribacter hydrothermalis]OBR41405.1 hypothetical protein A9200_13280 [Maribacter hydrothermalis]